MVKHFFHSLDQLSGMWHFCPAVLSDVLLGRISRLDTTESLCVLQFLQVTLINYREGRRDELAEGAIQRMVLRNTLSGETPHTVKQVQFHNHVLVELPASGM